MRLSPSRASGEESAVERLLLRALALVFLAPGGLLLWMSWVAWSSLFGGYRDSAVITYVVISVITLVLGAALVLGSWWLVRSGRARPSG